MKRFKILALVAAFILSSVTVASAADLEISGSWRVAGAFTNDIDFNDKNDEDHFSIASRARTTFEFVANEHLKAVTQLQFFNKTWGTNGAQMGDTYNVKARQAYIAFDIPNSPINIQAGLQEFATPSATNWFSPFDDTATGIVAAIPFDDMIALHAGWFRIDDRSSDGGAPTSDDADLFYADLAITTDAFEITPWFIYATGGKNADVLPDTELYYAALSATFNVFDPLTLAADLYYGKADASGKEKDTDGWGAIVSASYNMDVVTPEIFVGYFSGSKKQKKDGNLPMISADMYKTTFLFDGSKLGAGNILDGFMDFNEDNYFGGQNGSGIGTQAVVVGAALNDITFVEGLTHDLMVTYLQGTNSRGSLRTFKKKDKAFEVDFNTKYQIYEQLAAIVEIGYAKLDLDKKSHNGVKLADDDAFGIAFGIKYDF